MKWTSHVLLLSAGLLLSSKTFGQNTELIVQLSESLTEASGLINIEGQFVSHNDSGDGPYLYEVDTITGAFSRKVVLENAVQTDWESICRDETNIYIGDFGNNAGSRQDLRIYKLEIDTYLNATNDTVQAETIEFSYADQTSYEPNPWQTNFDAEAFLAVNDSLYLFSKNWGNLWTKIYAIPNSAGNHTAFLRDSINVEGLITDATIIPDTDNIILLGYSAALAPFIFTIQNAALPFLSSGDLAKTAIDVPSGMSGQWEGLESVENQTFFTGEENFLGSAGFCRWSDGQILSSKTTFETPYLQLPSPNPATDQAVIDIPDGGWYEVFDSSGRFIIKSTTKTLDTSDLNRGTFIIKRFGPDRTLLDQVKLVIP